MQVETTSVTCMLCVLCIYLFIYLFIFLNLCIGRVAGGSIPLMNTPSELDMLILRELLKSQIEIKQIKKTKNKDIEVLELSISNNVAFEK